MGVTRIKNYFYVVTIFVFALCLIIPVINGQCSSHHIECRSDKRCIPVIWQCDNVTDCDDASDELNCNKNECKEDNGGCSQICNDLPVGYECQCHFGYVLKDNRTCEDVHTSVLFTDGHDIRKIVLETSEYVSVIKNLSSSDALDYDYRTGTIYWSDVVEESIKSAPMDSGEHVTTIIPSRMVNVEGIAFDWIYGNIYWNDVEKNKIEMSDKTGKMRKTIINTDFYVIRQIALNPLDGWLFWSCWGGWSQRGIIERAGMDGSHRAVVISTDIKQPHCLALDLVTKQICWADGKLHSLSCADYNGDNQKVIVSSPLSIKRPSSIDIFEDWIYWSDWRSQAIYRVNKFSGEEKTDFLTEIDFPRYIRIYHPFKQPNGTNHCSDMHNHCSHLCLPKPVIHEYSPRFTCACPDGMKLTGNGLTCTDLSNTGITHPYSTK